MRDPRIESALIRTTALGRSVLHVSVQGQHHWTHGPKLYDHIQQLIREEQPGGILLDFLGYEYAFGNDVGCLFLVGFDRTSGVHRPLAMLAKGHTRAALGTLAALTKLRSFDACFVDTLEEALSWLSSVTSERPA
jgi:hypothetical protein